jgi:hypothetical protein
MEKNIQTTGPGQEEEEFSEGEEESYDSLEGKPEDYVELIKNARNIFEAEDEAEQYSKQVIIIGLKLKDSLMADQYKKMFDYVLPARRAAKTKGDTKLYASLVKRQLELTKQFYHIGDEAIDDAYGDIEKFEDSMVHWGETDPEFPKKLELFMEIEAMLYHAIKWEAAKNAYEQESGLKTGQEGYDPKYVLDLEKVIEMNK